MRPAIPESGSVPRFSVAPALRGKRDPALGPRLATEIPPRVFPPIRATEGTDR